MSEGEGRIGEAWSWRVEDQAKNEGLNLLYEPGTWGDVIKGAWAVEVALALAGERFPLRVLDPFAGAVDYPLVEASRQRLAQLSLLPLADLLRSFEERFPSTAALVERAVARAAAASALEARRAAPSTTLDVFDVDPKRRATWGEHPGAGVLEVTTGDAALGSDHDLVLVDPYDLFERADAIVPAALAGPESQAVLFYLFNKAPRGAGQHKRYLGLRDRIAALAGSRRVLVGRIPSDAILPRAYHEVLLVAPPALADQVEPSLRELTVCLSRVLSDAGAFERS